MGPGRPTGMKPNTEGSPTGGPRRAFWRLRRIIRRASSVITEASASQAAKKADFGTAKISESRRA